MPQARRRRCWRGWKPLAPASSWQGQQGGQACQCQRTSQPGLVLRRKGALHTPGACSTRGGKFGLSPCRAGNPETLAQEENAATPQVVDQEIPTETPAQEDNPAAPQFIEQESQPEALAPGAAVKPFCMRSLRGGLGRAVHWDGHWPTEWPLGDTYISGALAPLEEAESSLGPNQTSHHILDGVITDNVPLFCCPGCSRGLHSLPTR